MISRLRDARGSLAYRLASLLAIALLPIGLVSVLQTYALIEEADRKAEANLLALTYEAADAEAGDIRSAFGAGRAIAALIPMIGSDGPQCRNSFETFLQDASIFSFAGYVNADGIMNCSSADVRMDISDMQTFIDMKANPRQRVTVNTDAPISKTSVIVVANPVMSNGVFDGYVAISLPHGRITKNRAKVSERPVELITFNADGVILTADGGLDGAQGALPDGWALKDFVGGSEFSFTGKTRDGAPRVFAIVPIIPDTVYAMGSWQRERVFLGISGFKIAIPVIFPVLMWLACLLVAFFAVERMVIRPTRNLRARMLTFKRTRRLVPMENADRLATEIREMNETWSLLAESFLHDEAQLEDTVHEKSILLKEVHHRVKNNLQLIVSLLNMKIRKATSDEARGALRDIQQRVMSIATVHRYLYETSTEGTVSVDELIATIADRMFSTILPAEHNVEVTQEYDTITLVPDQAVPLTLAVSELLTNAIKHIGTPSNGRPWLSARLRLLPDGRAEFETRNSLGIEIGSKATEFNSKVGEQLIAAFAQQVHGRVETEISDQEYIARLLFTIADFDAEAGGDHHF